MTDEQPTTEEGWRAAFGRRGFSTVQLQYMPWKHFFHGPARGYAHKWLKFQAVARAFLIFGFVSAVVLLCSRFSSTGRADESPLPKTERLIAGSLGLVAAAWAFESTCGLPWEADHDLITKYLASDDAKRRDMQVIDTIPLAFGAMASALYKDHTPCSPSSELAKSVERGAETGRAVLEAYIRGSPAENLERDQQWKSD